MMSNQKTKQKTVENLSRREFLKAGTALSSSGIALGTSALSENKGALLTDLAKKSASRSAGYFPSLITDKCKRMNQKFTIFARQLWDKDLMKKIMPIEEAVDRKAMERVSGWTPLDQALNEAAWSVDHKFATGSEGGQPHSQAYQWDEPVRKRKVLFKDQEDASRKVIKAARFLGADMVGITKYNPLWTYSQLIKEKLDRNDQEEGPPQYEMIPADFPFEPKSVVAIAVEMDYETIAMYPSVLGGAATGLGYSHMSEVGYSVATFLRVLGYRSFACGNDVSLSIPYAIAAGLGELGRNGLLITQEFGPRVRLVKVFTELEIKPDSHKSFGVWDFCKNCKRCAESCPYGAIPTNEPTLEGNTVSNNPGVLKWYIDPEKCVQFWVENGSDCANCITACPYNKPAMWHHQLSAAIATSPSAPLHTLMARMDKLFGYGNTYDIRANAAFWDSE
jgi:reductive dehalogenase